MHFPLEFNKTLQYNVNSEISMLTLERQNAIRDILHREKAVSITVLSDYFKTSTASIRRDLEKLEQQGLVKRTYGGAVLI